MASLSNLFDLSLMATNHHEEQGLRRESISENGESVRTMTAAGREAASEAGESRLPERKAFCVP